MNEQPSNKSLETVGDVDPFGLREVDQMLASGLIRSAWYAERIESTNTIAMQSARQQGADQPRTPKLFLADQQTAGRGRHGRDWQSDSSSLTFSLMIDRAVANDPRSRWLPLAVGVGIAQTLEHEFGPMRAWLKWPNDVQIGGGKVAGILLEATPPIARVVIGVGINVGATPTLADASHDSNPSSIAAVAGRVVHRYDLLQAVTTHILSTVAKLDDEAGFVLAEFRRRCVLTGRPITYTEQGINHRGDCLGVDDTGALLVRTGNAVRRITSGEARQIRL